MSPLEYQIALRIRRAMNLLGSSELSVAQIAAETGFESHAYFSRFFRKETGISPIEYRRSQSTSD
jgi:transcriptional regulator GlxA family with amidase domain